MHKVSNKELLLMALMALPFIALGALATSQLPAYFQVSQQLGMRAFQVGEWYRISASMGLYEDSASLAAILVGVAFTTWTKRNWLGE